MTFAIIRGANGRRHDVDFQDAEIEVDIVVGAENVQITVEAIHDLARSDKRRFATLSIPREVFATALGADVRERGGRGTPGRLSIVPRDG